MVTADYHLNIKMSSPVLFQSGYLFNQSQWGPFEIHFSQVLIIVYHF